MSTIAFDRDAQRVRWNGESIRLTRMQTEILAALADADGKTVTKARFWDIFYAGRPDSDQPDWAESVLKVQIHRLRRKLQRSSIRITTVFGFGYQLHWPTASEGGDPSVAHGGDA